MSSETLRPGVARGFYPERQDPSETWLDRNVRTLSGAIARRRHATRPRLEAFAHAVETQAFGLRAESDAGLAPRIESLRRKLVIDGLNEALLPLCFALVREVARRTLGTPHYDVQLAAGWLMARGMLVEMETGEGKTLSATLPAAAAALAGIPVHVITANDYLVKRDADAMRPIYEALGLSVGALSDRERDPAARRAAYACNVTYGTAQQIAFDYLHDGLERRVQRGGLPTQLERFHRGQASDSALLMRGLCFAIVDEADSVLIDEARTPLILSGAGGSADQRRTYRRAMRLASALDEGIHYEVAQREGSVALTEEGRKRLEELAQDLSGFWKGPRRREEWIRKALSALHLFQRDRHYLVRDRRVEIIDQPTGRVSPDRSWEGGLHQLIELKENCPLTAENETLARISYQQFFRRYLRLCGMTGTAREVAGELWSVYRLNTVPVPTRLPVQRRPLGTRVLRTAEAKWQAVVESVRERHGARRPVLVGTCSVAESQHLSQLLTERGLPHQVLNALHDSREAEIVAQAGRPGRITVATNMAGRGTDIGLAPGVAESGGLHVIATQRSEARRIDRQLFGRCGRQGDAGSFEAILSLEDEPVMLFYPAPVRRLLAPLGSGGKPLPAWLAEALTRLPQRAEEKRHVRMRRTLMEVEEYLIELLSFSGPGE